MKTLLLVLSFFVLTSFSVNTAKDQSINATNETTVIICTGKYAKRYHNSICRGMNACKGEQKKVSLSKAKDMGLTPCGYCYK